MISIKNKIKTTCTALLISMLFITSCNVQPENLKEALQKYTDVTIKELEPDSLYKEAFEIYYQQAVNHNNKQSKKFNQKIYINHVGFDKPTVVILEGYTANRNYTSELSRILNANEIIIEHRFYGKSKPDSIPWDYLNIKQAAADHHNIIQTLKKIYKGKWISTGVSKGGQTTIFHRRFYPNDIDVSIPYVAPINFEREDPRINKHLKTVGTEDCRNKVLDFQKILFENKKEILPLLEKYATEEELDFYADIERAYDLNILEFSFAFWQWNGDCSLIPGKSATNKELFSYWTSISPFSFFAKDKDSTDLSFTYQALTELGMYSYDITPFSNYLTGKEPVTFDFKIPEHMKRRYNPEAMKDINQWLQKEGNYMIYICGEYDPWGATSVTPSENTNAVKFTKPGGNHLARIRNLPPEMQEEIYSLLENWLNIEID